MIRRIIFALLGVTIVVLWLAWPFVTSLFVGLNLFADNELRNTASLGDSFGSLSALFSAAAFVGVIYTLMQQSKQISQQQTDARRDQFEKDFRLLLSLLSDARSIITANGRRDDGTFGDIYGYRAINEINREIIDQFTAAKIYDQESSKDQLVSAFNHVDNRFILSMRPYFRILYTIFESISKSNRSSIRDMIFYGNITRGLMTSEEINILAISCLTPDSDDMYKYIQEYRLLRYMSDPHLKKSLSAFYHEDSFKSRDS